MRAGAGWTAAPARCTAMAALLGAGSWLLAAERSVPEPAAVTFTEIAAAAGCRNLHSKPRPAEELAAIMPWLTSVGAAVAAADFDGDGWTDLYVTNSGRGALNRLYRNRGDGTFEEVGEAAGVARVNGVGASMDALAFDHDDDGDQDLYLVRWSAPNLLFENRGVFRARTDAPTGFTS